MRKGQVVVGWLLVLVAGLTIVVAVASRSVSNLQVTERDEASARGLQTAQSALEEAVVDLSETLVTGQVGEGGFVYDYQVDLRQDLVSGSQSFVFPKEVVRDDTQTIWLVEHEVNRGGEVPKLVVNESVAFGGSSLELYWGNEGEDSGTVAVVSLIYEKPGGGFEVERYAFDPDSGDGCGGGDFDVAEVGAFEVEDVLRGEMVGFEYRQTLDLPPADRYWALRVRLLCNGDDEPQILGVVSLDAGALIPTQARCYVAVSTREGGKSSFQGEESTRLEQCLFYPSLPGIFDYTLFSGEGVTH